MAGCAGFLGSSGEGPGRCFICTSRRNTRSRGARSAAHATQPSWPSFAGGSLLARENMSGNLWCCGFGKTIAGLFVSVRCGQGTGRTTFVLLDVSDRVTASCSTRSKRYARKAANRTISSGPFQESPAGDPLYMYNTVVWVSFALNSICGQLVYILSPLNLHTCRPLSHQQDLNRER